MGVFKIADDLNRIDYLGGAETQRESMTATQSLHSGFLLAPNPPASYLWRGVRIDHTDGRVFRPSLDSYFLMSSVISYCHSKKSRPRTIVDLGTGTGVVGVTLGRLLGVQRVILVDHCHRARRSSRYNAVRELPECEIRIVNSLREALAQKPDLAVSNPPYFGRKFLACESRGANGNRVLPRWIRIAFARQIPFLFVFSHIEFDAEWLFGEIQSGPKELDVRTVALNKSLRCCQPLGQEPGQYHRISVYAIEPEITHD